MPSAPQYYPPALVLLLVACAAGGAARQPAEENSVQITVSNNLLDEVRMNVIIIPASGTEHVLGEVGPSETRTFRYPVTGSGSVRLSAHQTAPGFQTVGVTDAAGAARDGRPRSATRSVSREGATITSEPFSLSAGHAVTWELRLNRVSGMER